MCANVEEKLSKLRSDSLGKAITIHDKKMVAPNEMANTKEEQKRRRSWNKGLFLFISKFSLMKHYKEGNKADHEMF